MANEPMQFTIENAQLIFRNFSGREGQYNLAGDRNFSVILDSDTAARMERDGWNVKYLKVREDAEEGDEPTPYIPITVNFKNRAPRVVMITSAGRTQLDENTVGLIDYADIQVADLVCNAYFWDVNGKSGIKAYLKTLFVTINEDDLERKYAATEG